MTIDGKFYPQNLAIKYKWREGNTKDPLLSSQEDLSRAWTQFRYNHNLEHITPWFLKTATGECPELVKQCYKK